MSLLGGVCTGGSAPGGVRLPLWTEFLTYACENITFPQLLLRTVTTQKWCMKNQVNEIITKDCTENMNMKSHWFVETYDAVVAVGAFSTTHITDVALPEILRITKKGKKFSE